MQWVLASQSPRRRELLALLDHPYSVDQADIDETLDMKLPLTHAVEDLAKRKAQAVQHRHPEALIIAADTIVVLDDEILGKPTDKVDAKRMLHSLSGRTHQVITSMALVHQNKAHTFSSTTDVEFYPLDEKLIESYVENGQCLDKAGAYGIQDKGALLIKKIDGDYYTVMGLPIALLRKELQAFILDI